MTNPTLFDRFQRQDSSPAGHAESRYVFLNRAGRAPWARVRDLLEGWFSGLCPESQAHVLRRIRSGDDRQFQAGFWELYCHESLLHLGFDTVCEPAVAGTSRRPDFLASNSVGDRFVLEATVVGDSDAQTAGDRRKAEVFDVIDRLNSPDFDLSVEVHAIGPAAPPATRLRIDLENWLDGLDPDGVRAAIEAEGVSFGQTLPRYRWEESGWHDLFRPLPLPPNLRGRSGRPIGVHGPAEAFAVDDAGPLQKAIKDKANAYGELGLPFVVAVATDSSTLHDLDVINALFGHERMTWTPTADGRGEYRMTRASDGSWLGPQGVQNRRVSGVLTANMLHPWSVNRVVPTLWHHPAAGHPVALKSLPWRTAAVDSSGGIEYGAPSVDLPSFFHLREDWPGPEAPFDR